MINQLEAEQLGAFAQRFVFTSTVKLVVSSYAGIHSWSPEAALSGANHLE
jgi:hypothetical protein